MSTTEHDAPVAAADSEIVRSPEVVASGEPPATLTAPSSSNGPVTFNDISRDGVVDITPSQLSKSVDAVQKDTSELTTLRLRPDDPSEGLVRITTFPPAQTLVYLAPPEALIDLKPSPGDMGPFPVCSDNTQCLVFNFPPTSDERPKYRPKARRPNVDHVVCVLHDGSGDEAHFWINWAVRYEIETTVVLCGGDFEAKREALGEQVDLHHIHIQVLSDEAYREQVGDNAFATETQLDLSPETGAA